VIRNYQRTAYGDTNRSGEISWVAGNDAPGCTELRLLSIRLKTMDGLIQSHFDVSEPFTIEITYRVYSSIRGMRVILVVYTRDGVPVFASTDHDQHPDETKAGIYRCRIVIPPNLLSNIEYTLQLQVDNPGIRIFIPAQDIIHFSGIGDTSRGSHYPENWPGVVTPKLEWQEEKLE
jgi:hypothetical protein